MGTSWPLLGNVNLDAADPEEETLDAPQDRRDANTEAQAAAAPGNEELDPLRELELTLDSVLSGQDEEVLPVEDSPESFSASLERLLAESENRPEPGTEPPGQAQDLVIEDLPSTSTPGKSGEPSPVDLEQDEEIEWDIEDEVREDAAESRSNGPTRAFQSTLAWDLSEDHDWEQIELGGQDNPESKLAEPEPVLPSSSEEQEIFPDQEAAEDPDGTSRPETADKSAGDMAVEIWDELFFDDDHGIPDDGLPDTRRAPQVTFGKQAPPTTADSEPEQAQEEGRPGAAPEIHALTDTTEPTDSMGIDAGSSEDPAFPPRYTWFDPVATLAGEDFAGVTMPGRKHREGLLPDESDMTYQVTAAQLSSDGLDEHPTGQDLEEEFEVLDSGEDTTGSPPPAFQEPDDPVADDIPEYLQTRDGTAEETPEPDLISPFEAGLELVTSGTWEQPGQEEDKVGRQLPQDGEPATQPEPEPEPEMSQADKELMEALDRLEAEAREGGSEDMAREPAAEPAAPGRSGGKKPRHDISAISNVQAELEALARLFESGAGRGQEGESGDTDSVPSQDERPENFSHLFKKPRTRLAQVLTGVACLLLAAALAAQAVHHYRQPLLKNPTWGPRIASLYASLGMPIAQNWELDRYDVRQLGGLQDPEQPDNLIIGISLRNRASRPQPFPVIRLVLEDRWGQRVGKRDILPGEYLPPEVDASRLMQAGEHLRTDVAIIDPPGSGATNFQIDACLSEANGRLSCANLL